MPKETGGQNKEKHEFRDTRELRDYLAWKQNVPEDIRRIVEGRQIPPPVDLPLTDAFLASLAGRILNEVPNRVEPGPVPSQVANLVESLERVETVGGYVNALELLGSEASSWSLRADLYDKQIRPALLWLREQDLLALEKPTEEPGATNSEDEQGAEDGEKGKGEMKDESDEPPGEEAVSSLESEEQKSKEGEPGIPHFTLEPFFGGYHRRLAFNNFDITSGRWMPEEHQWQEFEQVPYEEESTRVLSGKVRGGKALALPVPYGFVPVAHTLSVQGSLKVDQNGLTYLLCEGGGKQEFTIRVAKKKLREVETSLPELAREIPHKEVPEIRAKIGELKKLVVGMKLAREMVKFTRAHLKYEKNNPKLWREYLVARSNLFNAVWQEKKADCYVANTEAVVEALRGAGITARFVGGYYCKEKDGKGRAALGASNGHAWLEVWDGQSKTWLPLDATPAGDPNVDQSAQEKELEGEQNNDNEGDWGELASEEEVKEELRKREGKEGTGKPGKKPEELYDQAEDKFAQEAGCNLADARKFLEALDGIRKLKNERGESISDKMVEEWQRIVEERREEAVVSKGPVRMDEGSRLMDPVAAHIDISSGERNPIGFEREKKVVKKITVFGGIDLYFSFDLSGSMGEGDEGSGRAKCDVQRDVGMLVVDSIMRCATVSRREESGSGLPIKIMATLARGRGEIGLPLTDKWGPKEQWALWSTLNKYASGGTPTHETLALINEGHERESKELKKKSISDSDLPLHYVVLISDGEPDNQAEVDKWNNKIRKKNMVVRSIIVGKGGIKSFSELPSFLQTDITEQFRKLRPKIN